MRGNKIWSIALLLSLTLSMLAIVVRPAPAQASATLSTPEIENPLMLAGESFTIDILVNNVVDLHSFDFVLNYETDILTATTIAVNPTDANGASYGFREITAADIDNAAGTAHVAANRGPSGEIIGDIFGIGDGVNKLFYLHYSRIGDRNGDGVVNKFDVTVYFDGVPQPDTKIRDVLDTSGRVRFATALPAPPAGTILSADYIHPGLTTDANFPVCSITFTIEARGYSPLDLQDVAVTDIYENPIEIEVTSGFFDNTFQGHINAPIYKDEALMPGSEFDLVFTAEKVRHPTWGIQFFLDYDTNVLAGPTYVAVAGLDLVTEEPVPIATVHFTVVAEGWTMLHIRDIAAVSIYGDALFFDSSDGLFASLNGADLSGRSAWPDTHQATYGTIDMLHARIATNATGTPVTVKAVFSIYDSEGGFLLGTIETAPVTIPELTTVEVTAPFDTTAYGIPRYKVWIGAQVAYDLNGDGIFDFLGIRVKPIPIMVKA